MKTPAVIIQEINSMPTRFTKLGTNREPAPADSKDHVMVLDNTSDLMWVVTESERMKWKDAKAYCEALTVGGFTDWRLPTVEELFLLADRSRHSPAIDTDAFPHCEGGWYWSSTPDAESPGDFAWYVHFTNGYSNCYYQDLHYHVRAVRPRQ